MKRAGMLAVSLRGVNFGFWSHLGCSGQNAVIFSRKGLLGLHANKYKKNEDQFRFQGNCPPTPPLSQHFAGGQFSRKPKLIQKLY